jgi:hypothetical protein
VFSRISHTSGSWRRNCTTTHRTGGNGKTSQTILNTQKLKRKCVNKSPLIMNQPARLINRRNEPQGNSRGSSVMIMGYDYGLDNGIADYRCSANPSCNSSWCQTGCHWLKTPTSNRCYRKSSRSPLSDDVDGLQPLQLRRPSDKKAEHETLPKLSREIANNETYRE